MRGRISWGGRPSAVLGVSWMRRLIALCLALCLSFCPGAEAASVARGVFLSELLEARGLDWSSVRENDGAAFILRSGLVTDPVGKLLVCFTLDFATALVEALRGQVDHLIHCESI